MRDFIVVQSPELLQEFRQWFSPAGALADHAFLGRLDKNNITITSGYLFSPTNQFSNFIRLNAAAWSYPIERAVEKLGGMVASMASRS